VIKKIDAQLTVAIKDDLNLTCLLSLFDSFSNNRTNIDKQKQNHADS
jgi:hypothetical protein